MVSFCFQAKAQSEYLSDPATDSASTEATKKLFKKAFNKFIEIESPIEDSIATALAKMAHRKRCPIAIDDFALLKEANTCRVGENASVLRESSEEIAQGLYLAGLAAERSHRLDCSQKQINKLILSPKNLEDFLNKIEASIEIIGYAKNKMKNLLIEIPHNPNALKDYEEALALAISAAKTIPFSGLFQIRQIVNYATSQYEQYGVERMKGWLPGQTKRLIKKALTEALEEIKDNKDIMDTAQATHGLSLDRSVRESLAQDDDIIRDYKEKNIRMVSELAPVTCQVDAKYGAGAQWRDGIALVGSLAGSLGLKALEKMGFYMAEIVAGSRAKGIRLIVTGTEKIVAGLNIPIEIASESAALSQIKRTCFGLPNDITVRNDATVHSMNALTCDENILVTQRYRNCIFVLTTNTVVSKFSFDTIKDAMNVLKSESQILKAGSSRSALPPLSIPSDR